MTPRRVCECTLYGLTVDQKDRVWAVGMTSHKIVGYDPKTDKWSVYATQLSRRAPAVLRWIPKQSLVLRAHWTKR